MLSVVLSNMDYLVYCGIRFAAYSELNIGDYLDIKAMKLELGPVQTLAHKEGDNWVLNDPPPNKALELAKCQKYQQELVVPNTTYSFIAVGNATTNNTAFFSVPIPTTMRANPTVIWQGSFQVVQGNTVKGIVNSMKVSSLTTNNIALKVTTTEPNLTPGESLILQCKTSVGSNLLLDANL